MNTLNTYNGALNILKAVCCGKKTNDLKAEFGIGYMRQQEILKRFDAKTGVSEMLNAEWLPAEFPEAALKEARQAARKAITSEELKTRTDLRDELIFTIDSASTCDIDDAISVNRTSFGYELGVHIADVSRFVPMGGTVDSEARARGTSVYCPDRDLPMLPTVLSKGACSLTPGSDRLTFSCLMEIDSDGNLKGSRFVKSIIKSKVKGVYDEINALFKGTASDTVTEKYSKVLPSLQIIRELYEKLSSQRAQRDTITFDGNELRFVLDARGRCVGVFPKERGLGERIIEEFMLLANRSAAEFAETHELPFLYRVHPSPTADSVERLNRIFEHESLALMLGGIAVRARELAYLIEKANETSKATLVRKTVQSCLEKAFYSEENSGHFALGLSHYSQFTSPIRRYPDLVIHRILGDFLGGMTKDELCEKYTEYVAEAAKHSTERERLAARLQTKAEAKYRTEYTRTARGREFRGTIERITPDGFIVKLENSLTGKVETKNLGTAKWKAFESTEIQSETGNKYTIGDSVHAKVKSVNIFMGQTELELTKHTAS